MSTAFSESNFRIVLREKAKMGVDKFAEIGYYTQADCNSGRHGEVA